MSSAGLNIDAQIGQRLRQLRLQQGLTLDALAHQSEVSRAMLSRIERGESSPTAQLLNRICGGLKITLSVLFSDTGHPANPLSRRAEQPVWRDPATGYLRRNVSPAGTGSPVDIVEVEFPAGGDVTLASLPIEGWDQHVWVLDGSLDLSLGDGTVRLEAGDCLRMRFDRPIRFHNRTPAPIRYAVIISHGAPTS